MLSNSSLTLNGVERKDKIGAGNFGNVYKGLWNEEVFVALKQLKNSTDIDVEASNVQGMFPSLIMTEMLTKLRHPNIVSYFGIASIQGEYYIVMGIE